MKTTNLLPTKYLESYFIVDLFNRLIGKRVSQNDDIKELSELEKRIMIGKGFPRWQGNIPSMLKNTKFEQEFNKFCKDMDSQKAV